MSSTPTPGSSTPSSEDAAGPDHRDLYLIVIGVLLGVLLGPGVLGRINAGAYDRFVLGGERALRTQLAGYERATAELVGKLRDTGVSDEAIQETLAQRAADHDGLREQVLAAQTTSRGRLLAIVIAVLLVMVIETLVDPRTGSPIRRRLPTVRYGLMALWIALLLAQPVALRETPAVFLVALVVVALAVGLVPLGAKRV